MKRIFYLLIITLTLLFSLKSWAQTIEAYQVNIISKVPPQNGANPSYMVNASGFIPAISSVYDPAPTSMTNVSYGQTFTFSYTGGSLKQNLFASPAVNPTFSYALCFANASSGNLPQGLCDAGYQQVDLCTITYDLTCEAQKTSGSYCYVNSATLQNNICVIQISFVPSNQIKKR